MFRACLAIALSLAVLVTAGCNTAPDNDEDYDEHGVLRLPRNVPPAPAGMVAASGDRFYLYVPQDWKTEPWKFVESDLSSGVPCELLDGTLNEDSHDPAAPVGELSVELAPFEDRTLEQEANALLGEWKKITRATVIHFEAAPVEVAGQASAFVQVMEAQVESQRTGEQKQVHPEHFLFVSIYTSVDPGSFWQARYLVTGTGVHEMLHHDSELCKTLVESVKSLVIVPDAAESRATP